MEKKALLTLMCSAVTLLAARANWITQTNLTNCNCAFSFHGFGDPSVPGTDYASPDITVTPGITVCASPSVLSGLSKLPATAIFTYIKGGVLAPLAGIGLACGDVSVPAPQSMPAPATAIPCNGNMPVTASWQQNAAGKVIVLIM